MGSGKRHPRNALSATFVRQVSKPGRYSDGFGLYLIVAENGWKGWMQRLMIRGKRCELGLGAPPQVSLAEARRVALANKQMARAGGDPLTEKRRHRAMPTFAEATRATHKELSPTWRNRKDAKAFLATIEKHTFKRFGSKLVSEVTSADIRHVILEVRERTPEVARKLSYRIAAVFRWAIAEGHRSDNPAASDSLALPRFRNKSRPRKALPYSDVANCIAVVNASNATPATMLALEFLILTAARSAEVRGATWSEIEGNVWSIPGQRMKMGRPHRVPLSGRALAILDKARNLEGGSDYIFPSPRGRPLSDMTLSKLVKSLGFDADVHGFRTSFRTWAQEQTNIAREVAEAALAHAVGDLVERSYARSDVFEKRRKLMESWANYLEIQRSQVVQFRTNS